MIVKEFTGKTVDEAIENGLNELGVTRESVEIKVLEEGKKKLFGSIKARVEISVKDEEVAEETVATEEVTAGETDGERAVTFLNGLFALKGFPISQPFHLLFLWKKFYIHPHLLGTSCL